MKIKIFFIVNLFFSLNACAQSGKEHLLDPDNLNSNSSILRTDGLYSTYETSSLSCGEKRMEHYKMFSPLYILNSGKAIYLYGVGDRGAELSSLAYFKNFKNIENSLGKLHVDQTTLKASLPIQLYVWGMRLKTFTAHFEGEIKNRDTIINWRMIPPYPNAPKKFNNDFKELLRPKLLYFVKSEELSDLDALYEQNTRSSINKAE